MPKRKAANYYAVRVGRKPGIYRNWNGDNGAAAQIKRISKYFELQPRGFKPCDTWQQADEYLRNSELYVVESSIDDRKRVAYSEDMSRLQDEAAVIPPQLTQTVKAVEAGLPHENPSVSNVDSIPYCYDEKLEEFLKKYYPERTFTDDQKAAIQAVSGAHLLYAIPGSGKTAVLTARAGYMIHLGIPAEKMLIMTFGKKASEHMGEVFHERFPDFEMPHFCTIHSFCNKVLMSAADAHRLDRHRLICDEEDDPVPDSMDPDAREAWIMDESADETPSASTNREDENKGNRYANSRSPIYLLERILTKLEYFEKQAEARQTAEQAAIAISCIKNRLMTDDEIRALSPMELGAEKPVNIWDVYNAYKAELQHHNPPEMDFDDMLILASQVLEDQDQLTFWQQKYPYISIDEAQDTSPLQHAIIRTLYADRANGSLFMVGDDDQSIYAFRGATPKTMLRFDQDYADAGIHKMGVNFRSDQTIVKTGCSLIQRNTVRAEKDMAAFSQEPGEIRIIDISAAAQGRYLLDEAVRFTSEQEKANNQNNAESMAILYRNNVSALLPLAYFFKYNIPFSSNKVFDILSILYSRTAINILSLLSFAMNPNDMRCYKSAYFVWNNYKGLFLTKKQAVEKLMAYTDEHNKAQPVLSRLQQLFETNGDTVKARHIGEVRDILESIRTQNNPARTIISMLIDLQYRENRCMRQKNAKLLVAALIEIASLYETIPEFVDAMAQLRAKKKWDEHNSERKPVVTLSTMHSAKGQEYDHVIIVDAVDAIMPGDPQKPLPFWHESWESHVEEERRLFYVAATRARHDVRIVVNGLNQGGPEDPTRFIYEILKDSPNTSIENLMAYAADAVPQEDLNEALNIEYFAVRKSKNPGIYTDYEATGIRGYSNPVYRSFTSSKEALRFLNKSVPCNAIPLELMHAPNLPSPVEHALIKLFHVEKISDLSRETITDICLKTDWMFSKEQSRAKAANYANCAKEYAMQYLPVNMHKVWQPLNELLRDELLPTMDEYDYNDGRHPIRILEMGVGPGTSTLGLLSFYSMLAQENPSQEIHLEYTPIEYEKAFVPVFDALIAEMTADLPPNLHVSMKPLQIRDAFAYLHNNPDSCYDLVLESNMLNHNEHVNSQSIGEFIRDVHRALVYRGKAVFIEPADRETSAFLRNAADQAADQGNFAVMGPRTSANDVSGVKMYRDACLCGLRKALKEDEHWFSYTVLTKTKGCELS